METQMRRRIPEPGSYEMQKNMVIMMAALTPSLMMGVYIFGVSMLVLTLVCAAACEAFAWACDAVMKRKNTADDFTAAVTGVILAFSLPARFPLWTAVLGCFVAIVMFREALRGFGEKVACPAMGARVFLTLMFTKEITEFPLNDFVKTPGDEPGALTGKTPLGLLMYGKELPGLLRMFIGFVSGPCGAVSVAAVLIGGLYLIWKKVIRPEVPAGVIITMFMIMAAYYAVSGTPKDVPDSASGIFSMAVFHIFAGGLMFAAFFCAGLYGELLGTRRKALIYACGVGAVTAGFRLLSPFEDGAAFAVLIMDAVMYAADRAGLMKPAADRAGLGKPAGDYADFADPSADARETEKTSEGKEDR